MKPNPIKKAIEDHDADTVFGGISDVTKIHEVRVFKPNGKLKKTISVKALLKREEEITKKKRKFNAKL